MHAPASLLRLWRAALLTGLAFTLAAPLAAQTGWTLLQNGTSVPRQNQRGTAAHAIRAELEGGTAWLRRLGFRAPDVHPHTDGTYKAMMVADAEVDRRTGTEVIAAYRWSDGLLTGEPTRALWLRRSALDSIEVAGDGRLLDMTPTGDGEDLASAVHEVFHGVQAAYRDPDDNAETEWIWEGMAEAVMHEWMRTQGRPYELRETDYSDALSVSADDGYDREHFWLSVGELLDPDDRIGYLRHVLATEGRWGRTPLPTLDAGLRRAAEAADAITPYRGGLYDLYPQVIAQHTTPDHFASVTAVEVGTPDVATARHTLDPLASVAFHVKVDVDESEVDYRGVPVRLTLDVQGRTPGAGDPDPRDAVHLIEGPGVVGRPALPETPYTHVVQIYSDTTLFVRVANVAERPAQTASVPYVLRIESEGYYGDEIDAEGIAAPLPPGFNVRGPGPWACRGTTDARAYFDLMTPDEMGRDVERLVPEMGKDFADMMDQMEIAMQRAERMGRQTGMSRAQLDELRERAEAEIARAQAQHQGEIDAAAADVRSQNTTQILGTFVGQGDGGECQMTLTAILSGREGGAQIIPGAVDPDRYPDDEAPGFEIRVFPQATLQFMRSMTVRAMEGPIDEDAITQSAGPLEGWDVCTMTDEERSRARQAAIGTECPAVTCTAGQLVFEEAAQGRIAGSFEFEVVKWPREHTRGCRVPEARGTVAGHFNVASTDDGYDDNSLGGLGLGGGIVPGAPIFDTRGLD